MLDVVSRQMRTETGPPIWLFSNSPRPLAPLRRATPRLLVRFERSIAERSSRAPKKPPTPPRPQTSNIAPT
jgi:hypothetical protein